MSSSPPVNYRRVLVLLWLTAWLVVGCQPSTPAPEVAEERGGFATLFRGDTTVVERFRRTSDTLAGELYIRPLDLRPDSARVAYSASLAPGGRVERIELTIWRIRTTADATLLRRWVTEFGRDSVVDREYNGTDTIPFLHYAYLARGPVLPLFAPSTVMRETMTMWARRADGQGNRIDFHIMPLATRRGPYPAYIEWIGRDSVILVQGELRGVPTPVAVDRHGRLLGDQSSGDFVIRRSRSWR